MDEEKTSDLLWFYFHNSSFLLFTKKTKHSWFVVHFLQATKNDEEDKIPSNHLEENLF